MTKEKTGSNIAEPLVSIIVPVYKVEKYLRRCVDSIVGQTYKNTEIILVDDGSPDNCGVICDEYAKKYSNIKVIHQENQGPSAAAARNNGVPYSKGEYITFVDSDDFVTANYVEYLLSLIKKYDAEISAAGWIYQYDNKNEAQPHAETKSRFFTVEEALITMNYGIDFSVVPWGKMYKRELIESFPYPAGKLYEDLATTYKIVDASTGVAFGNEQIYFWIQRSGSVMHGKFNARQFDGLEAAQEQLEFIRDKYPNALAAAKYRHTAKSIELAVIYFSSSRDKEIYKKIITAMNRYASEVLKDPYTKRSMKIRIIAIKSGYYPAKAVFAVHEKLKNIVV